MAASGLHISVAPEPIARIGNFVITNSLFTSFLVMLILFYLVIRSKAIDPDDKETNTKKRSNPPSSTSIIIDLIIEKFYIFFETILGKDKVIKYFPLLFTFFIFIIMGNWIGLIPGVGSIGVWGEIHGKELFIPILRGPNADLNTTLALALISVGLTQYYGVAEIGLKSYVSKFINFKGPISFFVGILELISEFAKVISFSFRLFGNIFAGEVLLMVMLFLVPLFIPIPFLALEVFIGFIQALVFTMLTTVFIVVATQKQH